MDLPDVKAFAHHPLGNNNPTHDNYVDFIVMTSRLWKMLHICGQIDLRDCCLSFRLTQKVSNAVNDLYEM